MAQVNLSAVIEFGANFGRSFNDAFARADKRLDNLRESYSDQVKELKDVRNALRDATDPAETKRLEARVDALNDSLRVTKRQLDDAADRAEKLGRATKSIQTVSGVAAGAGAAVVGAATLNQQQAIDRNRDLRRFYGRANPIEQTPEGFEDFQRDIAFFEGVGIGDAADELGELLRESSLRVGEALRDEAGALFDANEKLGIDLQEFAAATGRQRVQLVRDALRAANVSATESQFIFEEFFGGSASENLVEPYLAANDQIVEAAAERAKTIRTLSQAESDELTISALKQQQLANSATNLSNELALALAPSFGVVSDVASDNINTLADWVSESRGVVRWGFAGAAAVGAVGAAGLGIAEPLGQAGFAIQGVSGALGILRGISIVPFLLTMAGAFKTATIATWGFTAAILANPIGAIVGGVVLLIGVLVAAEAKFNFVTNAVQVFVDYTLFGVNLVLDATRTLIGVMDKALEVATKVPGIGGKFDGVRKSVQGLKDDLDELGDVEVKIPDIGDAVGGAIGIGEEANRRRAQGALVQPPVAVTSTEPTEQSRIVATEIQQRVEAGGDAVVYPQYQSAPGAVETNERSEVYNAPREVHTVIHQTNRFEGDATREDAVVIAEETAKAVSSTAQLATPVRR